MAYFVHGVHAKFIEINIVYVVAVFLEDILR